MEHLVIGLVVFTAVVLLARRAHQRVRRARDLGSVSGGCCGNCSNRDCCSIEPYSTTPKRRALPSGGGAR